MSTAISRLEAGLGVRLLERSTRSLRLTEAGLMFLNDIAPLFSKLDDVADHLQGQLHAPLSGTLRIASPYEFASAHLTPIVMTIMAEHPALRIEIDVVTGQLDPRSSGHDLSFVITSQPLPDSGQMGKRLYTVTQGLFAAPSFLAGRRMPTHPQDLLQWPLLGTAASMPWRFTHPDGQSSEVNPPLRLQTANADLRRQAAIAGQGVCIMSHNFAKEAVAAGLLLPLLPEWQLMPLIATALIPNRSLLPGKTRLVLEGLAQRFSSLAS